LMATLGGTLIRTSTLPPLTVSGLVETVIMSRSSGDLGAAATDPAVSRPTIKKAARHRRSQNELDAVWHILPPIFCAADEGPPRRIKSI